MQTLKLNVSLILPVFRDLQYAPKVDPGTIIAVAGAALSALNQNSTAAWEGSVSSKLDEIDRKLNEVIADIQQLRSQVDADTRKDFEQSFADGISSARDHIQDAVANFEHFDDMPDASKARILSIMDVSLIPTMGLLMNSDHWGYDGWTAIVSGLLTELLGYRCVEGYAGTSYKAESGRKVQGVIKYLKGALDAANPKSLQSTRNQLVIEAAAVANDIQGRLNKKFIIGSYSLTIGSPSHPITHDFTDTVVITATGSSPSFRYDYDTSRDHVPAGAIQYPGVNIGGSSPDKAIAAITSDMNRRQADYQGHLEAIKGLDAVMTDINNTADNL